MYYVVKVSDVLKKARKDFIAINIKRENSPFHRPYPFQNLSVNFPLLIN